MCNAQATHDPATGTVTIQVSYVCPVPIQRMTLRRPAGVPEDAWERLCAYVVRVYELRDKRRDRGLAGTYAAWRVRRYGGA